MQCIVYFKTSIPEGSLVVIFFQLVFCLIHFGTLQINTPDRMKRKFQKISLKYIRFTSNVSHSIAISITLFQNGKINLCIYQKLQLTPMKSIYFTQVKIHTAPLILRCDESNQKASTYAWMRGECIPNERQSHMICRIGAVIEVVGRGAAAPTQTTNTTKAARRGDKQARERDYNKPAPRSTGAIARHNAKRCRSAHLHDNARARR
jgi:hypothetical protein